MQKAPSGTGDALAIDESITVDAGDGLSKIVAFFGACLVGAAFGRKKTIIATANKARVGLKNVRLLVERRRTSVTVADALAVFKVVGRNFVAAVAKVAFVAIAPTVRIFCENLSVCRKTLVVLAATVTVAYEGVLFWALGALIASYSKKGIVGFSRGQRGGFKVERKAFGAPSAAGSIQVVALRALLTVRRRVSAGLATSAFKEKTVAVSAGSAVAFVEELVHAGIAEFALKTFVA